MTDDEMRKSPLTMKDFPSSCAHFFWKRPLCCSDCIDTVEVVVISNGILEVECAGCNKLLGVIAIKEG
jgi:hypothetical protein